MRYLTALILSLGLGAAAGLYTPAAKAGVVVDVGLPVPAVVAPYYYQPYYHPRPYWFGAGYYGPRYWYYGHRGYWGHPFHGGHWHR
jgi:hypothetical protein